MRFRSAILFLIVTCSVCNGHGVVTTDGCDVTKKCFQDPTGCSITDSGCRFISWRKDADGGYEFEMSGGEGGGSQYIAFALGLVNRMETADLYYCDGTQVRSGAIQDYHLPPKYFDMEDDLETKSASTVHGVGQCVLKRPASVVKNISDTEIHDFDIAKEQFYLLVAVGQLSANGEIQKHNWRNLTDSKIDFSEESQQSAITSDGCGATKNCYKDPENCDISESGCRFYSWSKGDGDLYNFEMSGGTGNGQQYIALALGLANQMKDADLYYCDGTAVGSGAIQELHNPPAYYEMTGGLATKSASTVNGVAKCVFSRPASVIKAISGGNQKNFDITKEEFHLLGAIGPMNGSHVQRHNVWITATANTFNFANEIEQSQITAEGCGSTKTCLKFPDNCEVGTTSCRFYSWQKATTEDTFNFEMVGSSGNGDQYVAFALGTQSAMTDADLYYCDGLTIRSGVITELHNRPTFLDITDGLQTVSATTIDGVAHCVLKRPASVTKEISGGVSKNFDLKEESYFLLAAAGNMDGAEIQKHTWAGKTDSKVVSSASKVGTLQPIFVWFVALLVARSSQSLAC